MGLNKTTEQCKHTPTHTNTLREGWGASTSCCDVITFHLMWKMIQSQWDGKCVAVYHRNWRCLLPSDTSFAPCRTRDDSLCLAVAHAHATVCHRTPHFTRGRCAHACAHPPLFALVLSPVYLFSFGCQLVFGSTVWKINLCLAELRSPTWWYFTSFYIPSTAWINFWCGNHGFIKP